ncbi:MAG TPA: hypothetical protein VFV70_10310 [Hyphomonadaceae bacterium]|nr:hypothetical protein [Hyphomonadaceae bacterium]
MAIFDRRLLLLAFPALAACASMQGGSASSSTAADAYAGKSVLDAAIEAAGGEAALGKVKELDWSGTAVVNAEGKTTEIEVQTIVRPLTYARTTSWPKAEGEKAARTLQVEFGKAWTVSRVTWTPMKEAEAEHENQQYALYGLMLLTSLKDASATVKEAPVGSDGTRAIQVTHPKAAPTELEFDATGKLVRAGFTVRDPKGGADIVQTAKFSGEIVSNGVKWPKRITIEQNGAPYFDLTIATFEARPDVSVTPLKHTLEQPGQGPGRQGQPGDENAG